LENICNSEKHRKSGALKILAAARMALAAPLAGRRK